MKVALLALVLFLPAEFRPAVPGYEFAFPRDHGSHPEYRTEWWYYTGHLRTESGKRYGFELTFFRVGMVPGLAVDGWRLAGDEAPAQSNRRPAATDSRQPPTANRQPEESRWDLQSVYPAHFAITDVAAGEFRTHEKMSRGSVFTAQAAEGKLDVFNESWRATTNPDGSWRISAKEGTDSIDLTLRSEKPPAIHGENGVSVKAQGAGFASHYYSMTRLEASGRVNGQNATGQAWMDHEFGSAMLRESQQGWDWFSVQLDNETELMLYVIRRTDGTPDVTSSGSLIASDGNVIHVRHDQMRITPLARWKSPKSGATYPMGWRVELPSFKVSLTMRPLMKAQELITRGSTRVTYWEGACEVSGTFGGSPVRGDGYVEMTGYDKAFRAP
ncbi:MAG: lipocalin-like domain-containing protein [Acidobacteriota bacterium]